MFLKPCADKKPILCNKFTKTIWPDYLSDGVYYKNKAIFGNVFYFT